MKILLLLIIGILSNSCYGQNKTSCALLNSLLNYSEARKVFYFDKHKEAPIVFIDTHDYFKNCAIGKYYGRKVKIVHDSSYLGKRNYSNIIINNLTQTGKKYTISVYYKIRSAIFQVEFKENKNRMIVTKFRGGYY